MHWDLESTRGHEVFTITCLPGMVEFGSWDEDDPKLPIGRQSNSVQSGLFVNTALLALGQAHWAADFIPGVTGSVTVRFLWMALGRRHTPRFLFFFVGICFLYLQPCLLSTVSALSVFLFFGSLGGVCVSSNQSAILCSGSSVMYF